METTITNSNFKSGIEGWTGKIASYSGNNSVEVTVSSGWFQKVKVESGRKYRIAYEVNCAKPAMLRLQVNWQTAEEEFISTSLTPESCSGDGLHFDQLVKSPDNAASAAFYVTAHDEREVEFTSVSMKD